MEGCGQTENFGGGTGMSIHDPISGHIGPPLACAEVKLIDVPEMEYYTSDKGEWEGEIVPMPRGEILLRGPSVFQGYFLNPTLTEQTLREGWLCTGDIGKFLPGGRVAIVDRKNNFFKLSQVYIYIYIYY